MPVVTENFSRDFFYKRGIVLQQFGWEQRIMQSVTSLTGYIYKFPLTNFSAITRWCNLAAVLGCWRGYLSGARCRLAYSRSDFTATYCPLLQ